MSKTKNVEKVNVYLNVYTLNPLSKCLTPLHTCFLSIGLGFYHTGL